MEMEQSEWYSAVPNELKEKEQKEKEQKEALFVTVVMILSDDFVYPPYSGSSILEGFFEREVKLECCIVMSGNPKGLE
jgi:hypothetical protein